MPLVAAPCNDKDAEKETDRRQGQHWYGTAQGRTYLRGRAGRRIAAHAAALRLRKWGGYRQQQNREKRDANATQLSLYWQNTSMPNRNIQNSPIECQYQAMQSTKI